MLHTLQESVDSYHMVKGYGEQSVIQVFVTLSHTFPLAQPVQVMFPSMFSSQLIQ
jgi:hypothetical protein